jgi:PAS domain S-box-containing protein
MTVLPHDIASVASYDRPQMAFIDNLRGEVSDKDAQALRAALQGVTCILLDHNDDEEYRRRYLRAGMDEVMRLADLQLPVGRHLFEKLLAIKDLADAEELVEQSEERFRGLIEYSHDMILLLDADGTVIYTSPAFGRQMGYEAWEVLGQNFFDFLHEDDAYKMKQGVSRLLVAGGTEGASFEFRVRQNGTKAYSTIEAIAANLLKNITVQALVFNCRDVTDQRRAEAELEKHRRHLEELVEKRTREVEAANKRADMVLGGSPDALLALDKDLRISFMSRHYLTKYPKNAPSILGMKVLDAFDLITAETGLSYLDPRYIEMRSWWMHPQGTREFQMSPDRWIRLQARVMEKTGETIVSTTDISDYKRQQKLLAARSDELIAALAKEKEIVEQQKTFVSMVSHEFRTPLAIIDGNAQIIQSRGKDMPPEKLKERTATIRTAVDRLVRLIETLLSSHMMESGKIALDLQPCDLSQIIHSVCADQQGISPGHHIQVNVQKLPPVMQLDPKLVRQMLTNLLSNAVKYSPKSPLIEVEAHSDGKWAIVRVRDHGVGIPESEQPKIFGKYFRASTSGGISGSGLGLSLVKQFVELHQGSIKLESKVGEGTAITVTLPVSAEAVAIAG